MADQTVEIENFGEGGVASEATLQQLLRAMDRMAKGSAGDAKKAKDATKKYHEELKSGVKTFGELDKSADELKESLDDASKASSRFGRGMLGLAVSGISTLAHSVVGLANELAFGGTQLADFTQHLPLVGGLLSPFAQMLDNSVESFRSLSASGASFNNSITEMRLAAATAELTLDEFQSFVGSNTESLRLLGGTVTEGVTRFTQINRALKQNEALYSGLRNMGFTVEEINEGLADYTQLQSRLGMLEGQSNAQLAAGAANYLKEIDALAKITGRQRDEIAQSMEQNAADASFRAIASSLEAQFGPDSPQLQNFQSSMALIDSIGGSTAIALKDLADGVPQTEEAIALINTAGPQAAEAMMAVANGADPQVLIDALASSAESMEGFAGSGQDAAAFIASIRDSNPAMAAILDEAFRLRQIGSANFEEARAEQAQRENVTATLTEFEDNVREIRASIARAFIDSGLFENLASAFAGFGELLTSEPFKTKLIEGIERFAGIIRTFIDDIGNVGFGEAISNLFAEGGPFAGALSGIGDIIGDAFKSAITSPVVIAALAGIFLLPSIGRAITGGIGGLFSGMIGGGQQNQSPRSGSGRSRGGNAGASVGRNVGGFVGGIAGGAMEGAARGLAAFANPAILAGAGILGASITAIGAGIAGATWLMGAALPTFAEGMESFENVDGAALRDAATGMLAISGAMAAFGAGSAVAGIGNLVGTITDGIASLFGGEDPMEKLQRFASYDIDAVKVRNNADAMMAFSAAMAAQGGGAAASGLGNLVGGIADGITSFFGGETGFPYDRITEFASYDIDATAVEANARAMVAFNNALMSASAGTAASGIGTMVGAISDFIGGLFGGDSPIEQVQEFGNMQINAEGVIANANAMSAMNEALSNMSESDISDFEIPRNLSSRLNALADIDSAKLNQVAPALTLISNALSSLSGTNVNIELPRDFANRLEDLSEVSGTSLTTTASGLEALSNVSGLPAMVTTLNSLDASQISSYNSAMESLVETLEELNTVLAETNDGGLFGGGTGVAAADVLGQIGGSTAGSNQQLAQLNNTMAQVLEVLREQYDVQEETARGTRRLQGNLIAGM